jgi:hypothetical protein
VLFEKRGKVADQFRRTLILSFVCLLALVVASAAGNTRHGWYQVELDTGETDYVRWSVGAKGERDKPLGRVCVLASMVEKPQESAPPYVEGEDAADCGRLQRRTESVSTSVSLMVGDELSTLIAAAYRPTVHKVVAVWSNGDRTSYGVGSPSRSDQRKHGVPKFRFVVIPVEGGGCIRRLVAFDADGTFVLKDIRPPC